MDADYVTALQYATKHDRTKQWVIRLCHAGRIEGAYMAGGVWVMPADAPLPDALKPGPKPNFDKAMAKLAMDKSRADRESRRAVELVQVEQIGATLHPKSKAAIDHFTAQGGVYDHVGNCHVGDRWLMKPEGWNAAAWVYAQSVAAGKPVMSDPVVKDWPSNEAEAMRKYDIGEGVAEGLPLATIKAQVKHWGADEQAYYDSLVSGTNNA